MMMFNLFDVIFPIFFIVFICFFAYALFSNIKQWHKNNQSPVIDANVKIVSKRQNRTHHTSANNMPHTTTSYYVTFEFKSGDRMELAVKGSEYGYLAEGDKGNLRFQGTRYISFERDINA